MVRSITVNVKRKGFRLERYPRFEPNMSARHDGGSRGKVNSWIGRKDVEDNNYRIICEVALPDKGGIILWAVIRGFLNRKRLPERIEAPLRGGRGKGKISSVLEKAI